MDLKPKGTRTAQNRTALLKRYGHTLESFDAVLASQNYACAICGRPNRRERVLVIDHSHRTGKTRGLLCDDCNRALGGFKDDRYVLQAAINYLTRYQEADEVPEYGAIERCGE